MSVKKKKRGRPSNMERALELWKSETATALHKFGKGQPKAAESILDLALGKVEQEECEYQAAGSILITVLQLNTTTGRTEKVQRSAFPDLDPEQLVLVKRKVTKAGPNLAAAVYIIDRIQGRPNQSVSLSDEVSELEDQELLREVLNDPAIAAAVQAAARGTEAPGA